jgi:hypothetical protein
MRAMEAVSRYREAAEQCFHAALNDPDSRRAVQFELRGREFLEKAERLDADAGRTVVRMPPADPEIRAASTERPSRADHNALVSRGRSISTRDAG